MRRALYQVGKVLVDVETRHDFLIFYQYHVQKVSGSSCYHAVVFVGVSLKLMTHDHISCIRKSNDTRSNGAAHSGVLPSYAYQLIAI